MSYEVLVLDYTEFSDGALEQLQAALKTFGLKAKNYDHETDTYQIVIYDGRAPSKREISNLPY